MTNFFYYSVPKSPADMTDDELEREITQAESVAEHAAQTGQGISSKENVRRRYCEQERDIREIVRTTKSPSITLETLRAIAPLQPPRPRQSPSAV